MTPPTTTASVLPAMDSHQPLRSARREQARGEMSGMDQGMRVLSYLIAGVLVYGGLGWWADHHLGTGFLLPIGIVLGAAGGCYVIIRRYGRVPEAYGTGEEPRQRSPLTAGDTGTRNDAGTTTDPGTTTDSTTNQKREGAR